MFIMGSVFIMGMSFTEIFILFLMTVIILMFIQSHYNEVEYVKSRVDGRLYLVRKLPKSQEASDFLAEINIKLTTLVRHMMAKYSDTNKEVNQLYQNYNPNSLSEGSYESGYTSYTVNKGEKIVLCIRQKDTSFVDKNTVMYVAIHELAHVMTTTLQHDENFWRNFKLLLKEAVDLNIYTKVDFNNKPQDYCGIKITSSII